MKIVIDGKTITLPSSSSGELTQEIADKLYLPLSGAKVEQFALTCDDASPDEVVNNFTLQFDSSGLFYNDSNGLGEISLNLGPDYTILLSSNGIAMSTVHFRLTPEEGLSTSCVEPTSAKMPTTKNYVDTNFYTKTQSLNSTTKTYMGLSSTATINDAIYLLAQQNKATAQQKQESDFQKLIMGRVNF